MSAHSLTKKFMNYRHIDTKNMSLFWPLNTIFKKLVAEYGDEFVEYLLNDTIAWAEGGNGNFFSPNFLKCRVKDVKPKFDADKKALEPKEELKEEIKYTQKTPRNFMEEDMSMFE